MRNGINSIRRRTLVAAASAALLLGVSPAAVQAQDLSGELVILQWLGGTEAELWADLQSAFMEANPGVTVRELVVTGVGDMRGAIRTALLGGETVDIIINTWPAFRAELADAGIIRPIDDAWEANNWSEQLSDSWRALGSIGDETYGLTYTYGNRSGVWYKPAHLENAGIEPPQNWDELIASFETLRGAGYEAPFAVPAQFWAHGELFETLLIRTAGVETASALAAHEIPWTDPAVRGALEKYAELLAAGCCAEPATMLASDWDGEGDQLFLADNRNYLLIGMWMNTRARNDYGLTEGVDYSMFQFPALGMGHDDTSMVDSKELNLTANGANPEAAIAFFDFMLSAEASKIQAGYGFASPRSAADASLLGPVQQISTAAVATSEVQFVLGDLLPGDLVDEYRVQLQRFLQDPSDAMIDSVLEAIEAKAQVTY
jgi:ABC-type glycerol-3-phosphate transport system substrate-binding protein